MGNHHSAHIRHSRKKKDNNCSIFKNTYKYINGRKYFKNRDWINPLPVDEEECDRSQLQHFLFHHIWEENFNSPVKQILENGGKVLDISCGAGAWLLEMATGYERTQFVGVDLVPIFPTEIKPHNLEFKRCDILNGLPFNNNEFDLVCIQNSSLCFTENQWKEIVIPEMVRVTKPNGWVEIMDVEFNIQNLPNNFEPLYNGFVKYCKLHDINLEIVGRLGELLQTHSLNQMTDFNEDSRKLLYYDTESHPESPQINMVTKLSKENISSFYHTISPFILPILGITKEECDEITDTIDINFEKNKCFNNMHRFYARKKLPED
ncbi:hypothetical protein RclHR1_12920006 [Rhizophagus clarus]|uniref:S-adenosyl-L-methionine-dependent methyltransferase n=1 Tax=Rhizophagus clarus TaxID=94130 RepID=A0A2Z6QL53_9GLOM|nr:hypothetical protein RclHR1_12920006 [Rhizophagus clarus]GES74936.1 S-adenosyl-L-methionine-dependent methyltransferase [Rhizophagus clarus]